MRHRLLLIAFLGLAACAAPQTQSDAITGPRTKDADLFARVFLDRMQARSFATNTEHCGLLGRDANGRVIATTPLVGEEYSCPPPRVPENFAPFASYHSHGGFDPEADSEVPSSYDVLADREDGLIGYISTPGGRIWRSENGVATLLCGPGCITTDEDFESGHYDPVARRYTIEELRQRELAMMQN